MAKNILLAVWTVLLVAGLLWGAWLLDSPKEEVVFTESGNFIYKIEQNGENTPADIMLTCSEDVMKSSSEAFARWLKLSGIPLYLPSGPMLIGKLDELNVPEELKPAKRSLVEVLKRHTPKHIVLIAHTNCIYYDTVAAWEDNLTKVKERQREDMLMAKNTLNQWLPKAKVSGYIAEEFDGRLEFRPVF